MADTARCLGSLLAECRGFGGGVSVILPSGGTPESQYPRASPGRLFLLGCLSVAALGFPVLVFVVVLRSRRCFSGWCARRWQPSGAASAGAVLGFPGSGFPATTAVFPGGAVGGDGQMGRLLQAFLSVAASRFAA